jgi:hypothetical protein
MTASTYRGLNAPISSRTTYRDGFCREYRRSPSISFKPNARRDLSGTPRATGFHPTTPSIVRPPDSTLTTYREAHCGPWEQGDSATRERIPPYVPTGSSGMQYGHAAYNHTTYRDAFGDPTAVPSEEEPEGEFTRAVVIPHTQTIRARTADTLTRRSVACARTTYRDAFGFPFDASGSGGNGTRSVSGRLNQKPDPRWPDASY